MRGDTMKMPIAWHEECLKNMEISLGYKKKLLAQEQNDIERMEKRIMFRKAQIEEAKRKNKDGFDEDKFLKVRKENK